MQVQEQLLFIQHLGDTMREACHLVHVVRDRANCAIQVGELLRECRGHVARSRDSVVQRQALHIGGDRDSTGTRGSGDGTIFSHGEGKVHAFRVGLVLLAVSFLVSSAIHRRGLKAKRVQRETRLVSDFSLPGDARGRRTPCQDVCSANVFGPAKRCRRKCSLRICNLARCGVLLLC